MAYTPPSKIGDTHPKISDAKKKLAGNSYGAAIKLEPKDNGEYTDVWTEAFDAAFTTYTTNVNAAVDAGKRAGPRLLEPPVFDWRAQDQMGFKAASSPLPQREFRNIWFYSAPGSGASWWVGPSFEVGEWCKNVLNLNHQPIGFPMGGYLGLMGGDPGLSYNEVIEQQYLSLKSLLDTNNHVQEALRRVLRGESTDIEFWFSGYSQSADGMEDALVKLFGDGAPYEKLRSRINGVIQFGNPSKKDTGIARKKRPQWLWDLVRNITTKGDFYAEAKDEIRPIFYAEIVTAETSLSFFGHVMKIAVPVLLNLMGSMFGLSLGGLLSGGALGDAKDDADERDHEDVDDAIIELLSLKGILSNIGDLLGLIFALPGIIAHGEYHLPKPEFGGLTGIDVGRGIVASFRR
jgi:hypothetical protein